jgi:hypothetical protein
MTLAKTGPASLSEEEMNELIALKEAITRSLEGKESNCPQ